MTQAPPTELQGPFTKEFRGLDTSSAIGSVDVAASPVFHNCDVSDDGAVIRRRGTAVVSNIDLNTTDGVIYTRSFRTRLGSEWLVVANSSGFLISLMRDNEATQMPTLVADIAKGSVWTTPPSSMQFLAVNSPYDRLLILTPEHPIVQLSFLERTLNFTCTQNNGSGNFTLSAPISINDTTLWRDTNAGSYIVTDSAGTVFPVTLKGVNFTFRLNGNFVVGQTYRLTVRQVTWQWWAESMYYEGADIMQNTSRFNVTVADQHVRVPERLITDLDPIFRNSQNMGLYAFWSSKFDANGYVGPMKSPSSSQFLEYGFSNGGRYVGPPNVAGAELNAAPFFATFGTIDPATPPAVNQVVFLRYRELRFNGNTGARPNDLRVYVDNRAYSWSITPYVSDTFVTAAESFNATDRIITFNSNLADGNVTQKYFTLLPQTASIPYNAPIHVTSVAARTYFAGASTIFYRDLSATTGGNLDGTYVRAYGIGKFVDYSKRNFHAIGAIYRDRLILVNPSTAQDQLVVSESGDETVPGEYYQFFQVTDMLAGVVTDPFTINVTSDAREAITALVGWQGNVFVFTNANTYSIAGGEQFGESNFAVNLVSTYGAFNQRCVAVTNLTVLYMNRFGIFDLTNKPNTENYGAFERSVKIRDRFRGLAGDASNGLHWLQYNESTNRLFVGLALPGDVRVTTRNLMLNITWDAWSTLSSVTPFRLFPATQLFRYTIFVASTSYPRYISVLCTDMPFYLDYATGNNGAYPTSVVGQANTLSVTSDARGIFNFDMPVVPGVNLYTVTNSALRERSYQRTAQSVGTETLALRNVMLDYSVLTTLLGGNANASVIGFATPNGYEPFTVYPTASFNGVPHFQWTITQAFGTVNQPLADVGAAMSGLIYPSVYASPVFDLESLGRLKRLKRLHLQMDTTIVRDLRYTLATNLNQTKVLNAALVSLVANYGESVVPAVTQYTVDNAYELRRTVQLSIPLQGYGCDYQFFITSVGAEAFKLAAYEFDIQPQRDKRYVRR